MTAVFTGRVNPIKDDGGLRRLGLLVVWRADEANARCVRVVTAEQLDLEVELVVTVLDTRGRGTPGVRVVPTNKTEMFPVEVLIILLVLAAL